MESSVQPTPDEVESARAGAVALRREDLSRLREHPERRAMAAHHRSYEEARADASRACLTLREAYAAHCRAHSAGYPPDSQAAFEGEALRMAIHHAEIVTFEAHGWTLEQPPQSIRELRERLEALRVAVTLWSSKSPTNTSQVDALWEQAEQMRSRDPAAPELPARPEGDGMGISALVQWCDRCREAQHRRLGEALAEFGRTLELATVGRVDGVREVAGPSQVALLNAATAELLAALARSELQLVEGVLPPSSGTSTSAPEMAGSSRVGVACPRPGPDTSDPALAAAFDSIRGVLASPDSPMGEPRSEVPVAGSDRWRIGDVVRRLDLARLDGAARLFAARAGRSFEALLPTWSTATDPSNADQGGTPITAAALQKAADIRRHTFGRIRDAAGVPARPRAAGLNRGYTPAEVAQLIAAVKRGNFHRQDEIVAAWVRISSGKSSA